MRSTLIVSALLLLFVAVLVILHGPAYGFPTTESFQSGFMSLPDWALALIFAGIGIGTLVIFYGAREAAYAHEQKHAYGGVNVGGIFDYMNPPTTASPRRSKSRSSRKAAEAAANAAALAARPRSLPPKISKGSRTVRTVTKATYGGPGGLRYGLKSVTVPAIKSSRGSRDSRDSSKPSKPSSRKVTKSSRSRYGVSASKKGSKGLSTPEREYNERYRKYMGI